MSSENYTLKSSLGGGFRVSNVPNKLQFPTPEYAPPPHPVDRKADLVSNLDWEIEKLRRVSTNMASNRMQYTQHEQMEMPTSLEEIEKLRLANKARLQVLEREYLNQKQQRSQPVKKISVMEDYGN